MNGYASISQLNSTISELSSAMLGLARLYAKTSAEQKASMRALAKTAEEQKAALAKTAEEQKAALAKATKEQQENMRALATAAAEQKAALDKAAEEQKARNEALNKKLKQIASETVTERNRGNYYAKMHDNVLKSHWYQRVIYRDFITLVEDNQNAALIKEDFDAKSALNNTISHLDEMKEQFMQHEERAKTSLDTTNSEVISAATVMGLLNLAMKAGTNTAAAEACALALKAAAHSRLLT